MAANKGIRSKSATQPKEPTQAQRQSQPQAQPEPQRCPDHQGKAEIFEALRRLNRGYGLALAALDKLEIKARYQSRRDRPIFPRGFLLEYHSRTEILRAEANRDLLRMIAGHEEREAAQFAK